jgi:hypothetical protein
MRCRCEGKANDGLATFPATKLMDRCAKTTTILYSMIFVDRIAFENPRSGGVSYPQSSGDLPRLAR